MIKLFSLSDLVSVEMGRDFADRAAALNKKLKYTFYSDESKIYMKIEARDNGQKIT